MMPLIWEMVMQDIPLRLFGSDGTINVSKIEHSKSADARFHGDAMIANYLSIILFGFPKKYAVYLYGLVFCI